MSQTTRVAFVGAGHHATRALYPHLHEVPDLDLVAVCDLDREKAERNARWFGGRKIYTDVGEMLSSEQLDGVYICGLPQMISTIYGSLPIVHATGGLRDTIVQLDVAADRGNGFVFDLYDSQELRSAIDQAMRFYRMPEEAKAKQIARIMRESAATFNHAVTAEAYFDIYETMLKRPLVEDF